MGNKDAGRAIANLDNISYMQAMGANVSDEVKNTGIDFTTYAVYKYYRNLREYTLNRIAWFCDSIPEYELRLIEWNIFHYGKCAMLKPSITRNNIKYTSSNLKIYKCNYTDFNRRNGRPYSITILNTENNKIPIDSIYNSDDFVIFTDEYLQTTQTLPMYHLAWEFANKLYEIDLAFNANAHKLRMPFVFNKASSQEKEGYNSIPNKEFGIAEIMRSAYGRNEQFAEVPESMVGNNGFMYEPSHVDFHLIEHLEAQKKVYESYFEVLGLYTNKEKSGVYTIKDLQKDGDETGDFRTETLKSSRYLCAKEASEKFNINIGFKVV